MEFFPSINQFKDVVKAIRDRSLYFHTPLPTMEFTGTVKLHGMNGEIWNETGEIVALSRARILGEESDNAGFYSQIVHPNLDVWEQYLDSLGEKAAVFGEWYGSGIQKEVAISSVPKKFIIFACRVDEALFEIRNNLYCLSKLRVVVNINEPHLQSMGFLEGVRLGVKESWTKIAST